MTATNLRGKDLDGIVSEIYKKYQTTAVAKEYIAIQSARELEKENVRKTESYNKKKALSNSTSQLAVDAKLITIPSVSILLEFEEVKGFPGEYDQQAMCSHLKESNCHFKVKKPRSTSSSNEFVFATKNKMYEIMKDLCFTSLECASQCTDAKIIDDPDGFNINGMKPSLGTASPATESVTDEHLMATIFVSQTMVQRKKNLILKDGSVFHPIVDKRKHNSTDFKSETCLALEGQIQGRQRCYLCLLCFAISKNFKSPKPECPRKHINKVHHRTTEYESSSLDVVLKAVMAFVNQNDSSLSVALDHYFTKDSLQLANIDPALLSRQKVKDVIISLGAQDKGLLKEVVSDMHYKIPNLNSYCSDFYERILEETSKCHTFYSLTQDGLTVKKTNFESIILHLNSYYKLNYHKEDIESDYSSHLLSVKAVNSTSSQNLYEHTLGVINERIGNINSLGGITTDDASNVTGMRELFAEKHKVFSLRCTAQLIELFYSQLFKLLVDTKHTLKLHPFDQFFVVMSQVDVSIEDCHMLIDKLPAVETIAINTPKKLQKALQKTKDMLSLSTNRLALERIETGRYDPSQPGSFSNHEDCDFTAFDRGVEEDTDDDELDGVESSEDLSETISIDNNNVNSNRAGPLYDNDDSPALDFLPEIKIDFENVAPMPGLEDVISDDRYFINILERATNISTLETIIQKLDDCDFDTQHEDFAAALKYLKSVNFGISHIQQMNKKLRSFYFMLDQKSQTFLGLCSTPKKYIETKWVSLKAFYEPYITPICRPVKFKEHNQTPGISRKVPLSFWLTYEDLIFMRVMMGYLNELSYLTNAASHTNFSVFSMRVAAEMAFEVSSTMLYNFFKIGILDEAFYSATLKSNINRISSDIRGTLQDLCYMLNPHVAGTGKYLSETAILVHQILKYKFTDELFMDKDNYLSSKLNSSIPQLNNLPHNYNNVKELRVAGRLDFGLQPNHRILKQFKTTGVLDILAQCNAFKPENKNNFTELSYKQRTHVNSPSEENAIFKPVNGNHTAEEKLLSLVAKDVAVYSRISDIVKLKNQKFLLDFQKKNEKGKSKTYSRIYLHLRKIEINNLLTLSTFLEQGYNSPLTWVMNLLMSMRPTSVDNERVFSHQEYVDNIYRNNLSEELFESLVPLTLRSRASKNSGHFDRLYKGVLIRKRRDLKYQTDGAGSDTSDREDVDNDANNDGVGNAGSNPATKRTRVDMES